MAGPRFNSKEKRKGWGRDKEVRGKGRKEGDVKGRKGTARGGRG